MIELPKLVPYSFRVEVVPVIPKTLIILSKIPLRRGTAIEEEIPGITNGGIST
jgi:hypothetical protein